MDNPHLDCELNALAQACDARAAELQACAWSSESERNALREDTAQLLARIARQLSDAQGVSATQAPLLSSSDLRRIIESQVVHAPLSATAHDHAWVDEFIPGMRTPAKPTE